MGLYVGFEAVRDRLVGKVRFTARPEEEGKMSEYLANRLINEAEGQVEQDLSPRYSAPFQGIDGAPFSKLPPRPTTELIRTLCELQACMRILECDFGSGSATDGEKYTKRLEARYNGIVDKLLKKKKDGNQDASGWFYPPLPGLQLNYGNNQADDGFAGMALVASGTPAMGYAIGQINSPGEGFFLPYGGVYVRD